MDRTIERERVQDELIFNVTEDLLIAMEDANITKTELARRLNKSKSRVSQMLSGESNITLRTLASMCFELGVDVDFRIGNEFSVRDPRSNPEYEHENSPYFEGWQDQELVTITDSFVASVNRIGFDNCRATNDSYYRVNDANDIAEA